MIEVAPAALDSDLEAVAPLADGVLLVAESGRTRPREIVDATERLAGVNAKLLGVTLLRRVRARRRGKGPQAGARPVAANRPAEPSATTRQARVDAHDPREPAASPGGAR